MKGEKMTVKEETGAKKKLNVCPKCGKNNERWAKVCNHCGEKLCSTD